MLALVGPPGAGKSTLAVTHAATLGEHAVVLSLDAYRAAWSPWGEEADQAVTFRAITSMYRDLDRHLAADHPVVVDATNAKARERRKLLAIAIPRGAVTTALVVLTPLEVCLARNARRDGTVDPSGYARRVPDDVVARIHATISTNFSLLAGEGWHRIIKKER